MLEAYKKYWLNYANFNGKSSRSDFWWVVLWNTLITLPFGLIGFVSVFAKTLSFLAENPRLSETMTDEEALAFGLAILSALAPIGIIFLVWWLATLLPNLALEVRRYRDAGFSWAFIFLNVGSLLLIIPLIGWLIYLATNIARFVLLVQPSRAPQKDDTASAFSQPQEDSFEAVLEKWETNPDQKQDQNQETIDEK